MIINSEAYCVVGGRFQVTSFDSKAPLIEKNLWGEMTDIEVSIANFECWSLEYGWRSQGYINFYLIQSFKKPKVSGSIFYVTCFDATMNGIEKFSWGEKNSEEIEIANGWSWSVEYGRTYANLNLCFNKYAEQFDDPSLQIVGGRFQVTNSDSTSKWIEKFTWGEKTDIEVPIGNFKCCSSEYDEGYGYLSFYLKWQDLIPNEKWMEAMSNLICDKRLIDMVLPGTHDSGTSEINISSSYSPEYYTESVFESKKNYINEARSYKAIIDGEEKEFFSIWAKTQPLTIEEQLYAGIRYFDLRICMMDDGKLYFCHGMRGALVSKTIKDIKNFIKNRRKEIIVLDFNHFYPRDSFNHEELLDELWGAFKEDIVYPPSECEYYKIKDIWDTNRQIIVFYDPGDCSAYKNKFPWIWPASSFMKTFNAGHPEDFILRIAKKPECNMIFNAVWTEAFDYKVFDQNRFAEIMNKTLENAIKSEDWMKWRGLRQLKGSIWPNDDMYLKGALKWYYELKLSEERAKDIAHNKNIFSYIYNTNKIMELVKCKIERMAKNVYNPSDFMSVEALAKFVNPRFIKWLEKNYEVKNHGGVIVIVDWMENSSSLMDFIKHKNAQ